MKDFTVSVDNRGVPATSIIPVISNNFSSISLSRADFCWWYWMLAEVEVKYSYTRNDQFIERHYVIEAYEAPLERFTQQSDLFYEMEDEYIGHIVQGKIGLFGDQSVSIDFWESDPNQRFVLSTSPLDENVYFLFGQCTVPLWEKQFSVFLYGMDGTGTLHDFSIIPFFFNIND